ncbi:hypothetical protein M422DRAFT_151159 [Sphaerobolus stellatus SS14]|nr:hypothetical protein M422DRAFT_151159 [Sphaerobolus stellatus SS14]
MNAYRICLRLANSGDSSIHRPKSIFDTLPNHQPSTKRVRSSGGKLTNDWRFGPISVEWIDRISKEISLVTSAETPTRGAASVATARFIETKRGATALPEGIVHIYRCNTYRNSAGASGGEDVSSTSTLNNTTVAAESSSDGTTLAVLAVPSHMTASDFLSFVEPAVDTVAHLRMIRDTSPSRSIVIIKFRNAEDARYFLQEYNGRPFNAMQPEICHVVNVVSIEIEANDATSLAISRLGTTTQSNLHELPTCPVCLERMDASITGLVTVPCSHTFHCMCLSKWGDSRCPICRYSQRLLSSHPAPARPRTTESGPSRSMCFDCSSTTNLWICLICGNIGCGRYGRAHAHAHYELTTHLYSLELETQRVWDYAGDGYVHRLIQNKADGKLVELPSAATMASADGGTGSRLGPGLIDSLNAEKIEAIGIEYSSLLTSQLDSQRTFYEEQKIHLEKMLESARDKIDMLENELQMRTMDALNSEVEWKKHEEEKRADLEKALARTEKRVLKLMEQTRTLEKDLREERAVNEGLLKNNLQLQEKAAGSERDKTALEKRMTDMEEQLQDLMANIEMRERIKSLGDAEGGSIQVSAPPPPTPSRSNKKKSRR